MTSDIGYFGPDSVTWQVHREATTMVGGLRALLLQALHPEAMRLLAQQSNYRDDPWQRLNRTAHYVASVTFGDQARADAAAAQVRQVHGRLGIDDPEQLAWVHACEVDSFIVAARRSGLRFDVDRYLGEQLVAAGLVGVPDDLVAGSARELADYFARMRPRLALTPQARDAARYVVLPPLPVPIRFAVPARLGWTTVASLAVGMLPGWARRMYRLPPLPGSALATATGLHALRLGISSLPPRYRDGPEYRAALRRVSQPG